MIEHALNWLRSLLCRAIGHRPRTVRAYVQDDGSRYGKIRAVNMCVRCGVKS